MVLTAEPAGIREMERTLLTVSSRVVMTKQKVFSPTYWHKQTMVSCCIATAITGKLISKRLTRLMNLASVSRVIKKSLWLVSEVAKVVCVEVPSWRAVHTKSQERAASVISN